MSDEQLTPAADSATTSPEGDAEQPAPQQHEEQIVQAALRTAAQAGVHCLAIPTPFMVGRVNAYLIEDSPLTLVDSGPNSAKALDELERALAERGHAVEDIELLVITHQHIDHFGLASILARRSGAEVAALDRVAPYLAAYGKQADEDDRFAQQLMLRHGIPPEIVTALRAVSAGFRAWGAAVQVTRPLHDGEELRLRERTLRVLDRPGHSPSDTVFWDEQRSMLIAADHLIAHISSNPLLARPLEQNATDNSDDPLVAASLALDRRPRALLRYIESLEKTRAMELSLVLSGHGRPIIDHVSLIDERFRLHRRRAEKMRRLIAERPRTAHEIAQELWGNVAVTQAFLTLSEVLGHVDLLLRDGVVAEQERDGVVRFSAV